jgi:HEPN domain-containing protein/predicted nucleotidyltransferase
LPGGRLAQAQSCIAPLDKGLPIACVSHLDLGPVRASDFTRENEIVHEYKMKKCPKHLPLRKLDELKKIVQEIRARHEVEMIILFGSHARDDWVEHEYEEDHITYSYHSDFDVLIITADKGGERDINHDKALRRALQPEQEGTRVSFIVHTLQHVNQMLSERRFFFMDLLKEGYQLYDSGRYKLARPPKKLPPDVMLRHARDYFKEWIASADDFNEIAQSAIERGKNKPAAFLLRQSTERYITCLLLVRTGYRPKEHDLECLINHAAGFASDFNTVFPNHSKKEQNLFDLLRRAYVDARYNKAYQITNEELEALTERVKRIREIVEASCGGRIEALLKCIFID